MWYCEAVSFDLTNPIVQGALIGAAAGVIGVIVGALIGALAASRVANASLRAAAIAREEARKAHFADETRRLAAELVRGSAEHRRQVREEIFFRHDAEGRGELMLDQKPEIGSTEPLYLIQAELHVTALRPETASSAHALYRSTVALDRFNFNPKSHLVAPGKVANLTEAEFWAYMDLESLYLSEVDNFLRHVRVELGREPFDEVAAHTTPNRADQ